MNCPTCDRFMLFPAAPCNYCHRLFPSAGSLARCIHRGSFPESSKLGGTTIGTDDPSVWQYLLWFGGNFWTAELHHDVRLQEPCSFNELLSHFDRWRDSGKSPWRQVFPENAQ